MEDVQHVVVFRCPERYAAWPANYGIWGWGNEVVSGFTLGFPSLEGGFHSRDRDRPFLTMQSRTYDGGLTWESELAPLLAPGGGSISAREHMNKIYEPASEGINPPIKHPGTIDIQGENFALLFGRTGLTAGSESWFYTTNDRCVTWQGPFLFPMFEQSGVSARTDYLIDVDETSNKLSLLLTATKPNGNEGRVFYAQTTADGSNFEFCSWLREHPSGFDIMPSSVKLPSGLILTAVRCRTEDETRDYIDLFKSEDNGFSWELIGTPVDQTGIGGNPPALLSLSDGRLCLIYGYRNFPFGIYAVMSSDNGVSWSDRISIRTGAGNHDIGYPRAVEVNDGRVLIYYYFNDNAEGERYIAASIWKPSAT